MEPVSDVHTHPLGGRLAGRIADLIILSTFFTCVTIWETERAVCDRVQAVRPAIRDGFGIVIPFMV